MATDLYAMLATEHHASRNLPPGSSRAHVRTNHRIKNVESRRSHLTAALPPTASGVARRKQPFAPVPPSSSVSNAR
eukprot:746495-Rhodomonas_salina.2